MPGKILGLDINDDAITAVQVVSTLKGYQITAFARVTIDGDDGLDNALEELFARANLKTDICHSSIPAEHVSYRNLRLPFKDSKKIRQTLPFEIEAMLPFPINDMIVDFTVIARSDQTDVLAGSVEKAVVNTHLEQLQAHGVDPDILDIRCMPAVVCLLKLEGTPDNGLFLQLDGKRNTMVLFLKRRIVLVRTFDMAGVSGAMPDSNETNSGNAGRQTSDQVASYYKSLCTLIENTVHAFESQNNTAIRPEKIFFTGIGSLQPESEGLLKRFFGISAEQVDLTRDEKIRMETNIARNWNPALMGNALALALREPKQDQGFNFRRYEFEKKKHYFGSKKEIRNAAIFFAVLLFFLAIDMGADYYFLKKRYQTLDHNITEIFKETLPGIKRIVDPVKQMQIKINEIRASALSHPTIGGNKTVLEILEDISQRISETLDVHINRMVIDSEVVRITGKTDTFNTVDKIKNDLEASDYFSSATISAAKLNRAGTKVEFEIKLERAK